MPRHFQEKKLVLASHNEGKVREIGDLLAPYDIDVVSARHLNLPEPEETGTTFPANAELKARAAADASGLPALADDSGLCVAALGGDPGIYSARWGGENKDFQLAMQRVHTALADHQDKSAWFICALALVWPDGHLEAFEGRIDGQIVDPARGTKGFGYDPVFVADGYQMTFGEMAPAEKHVISHRADAFRQLVEACFST